MLCSCHFRIPWVFDIDRDITESVELHFFCRLFQDGIDDFQQHVAHPWQALNLSMVHLSFSGTVGDTFEECD